MSRSGVRFDFAQSRRYCCGQRLAIDSHTNEVEGEL